MASPTEAPSALALLKATAKSGCRCHACSKKHASSRRSLSADSRCLAPLAAAAEPESPLSLSRPHYEQAPFSSACVPGPGSLQTHASGKQSSESSEHSRAVHRRRRAACLTVCVAGCATGSKSEKRILVAHCLSLSFPLPLLGTEEDEEIRERKAEREQRERERTQGESRKEWGGRGGQERELAKADYRLSNQPDCSPIAVPVPEQPLSLCQCTCADVCVCVPVVRMDAGRQGDSGCGCWRPLHPSATA